MPKRTSLSNFQTRKWLKWHNTEKNRIALNFSKFVLKHRLTDLKMVCYKNRALSAVDGVTDHG